MHRDIISDNNWSHLEQHLKLNAFPGTNSFVFKNSSFFNKPLLRITHNLIFGDLSNSRYFRLCDKFRGRKKVTIVLLPTQTVIVAHVV
jgi:hypothetical protein